MRLTECGRLTAIETSLVQQAEIEVNAAQRALDRGEGSRSRLTVALARLEERKAARVRVERMMRAAITQGKEDNYEAD